MSTSLPLQELAACFAGAVPSALCTRSRDGTPNITYLDLVCLLDPAHVAAISRGSPSVRSDLEHAPRARIMVFDPATRFAYRLDVVRHVVRDRERDVLLELARAQRDRFCERTGRPPDAAAVLAIFEVVSCAQVPTVDKPRAGERAGPLLRGLCAVFSTLGACSDLEQLLSRSLEALERELGFEHAMLLLLDEGGDHLFVVASQGHVPSGVGAEVALGHGIAGAAAEQRRVARRLQRQDPPPLSDSPRGATERGREILAPGLVDVQSEIALPLLAHEQLLGVLWLQSPLPARFGALEELVLSALAQPLAALLALHDMSAEVDAGAGVEPRGSASEANREPLVVKHYAADDSVFLDQEYLIKGAAGRILWRLLQLHEDRRDGEFSNRELRLDKSLRLPALKNNLEARLIVLRRRLAERGGALSIEPTGRGRFRLDVRRPLILQSVEE